MSHTPSPSPLNALREIINSHHLKPSDKSADDIILEILSDIEKRDYSSASQTICTYIDSPLLVHAIALEKLSKEEKRGNIKTNTATNKLNKKYYSVLFFNKQERKFYCYSFYEAIILGMAYAIEQKWTLGNCPIESITDNIGVIVNHIIPPMHTCLQFERKDN